MPNVLDLVLRALPILLIAIAGLRCARFGWHLWARRHGLAHPGLFHYWLIVPWRWFVRVLLGPVLVWFEQTFIMGKKATAKWAGFMARATLVYKPGRVLYGRQHFLGIGLFQPIGEQCERHLFMIAGTGGGKTTQLITMLSLDPGNAFVIDPKGVTYLTLEERFGSGGKSVIPKPPINGSERSLALLDPNGVTGRHSQSWNMIDELGHAIDRHGEGAAVRYATRMAEGLVKNSPGTNEFFPGNARGFIMALLLYVLIEEPPDQRHMVRFRELLTSGLPPVDPIKEPFQMLLYKMQQCQAFEGVIARAASTILGSSERARGDILTTAREQTKWLDLPEIAAISKHSDFALADLKTGGLSLFICAGATDISTGYAPWVRSLTMMALYLFEQVKERSEHPCFFVVDEMPSLGPIEGLDKVAPLMRDYGVRLLCISQGVGDLSAVYPNTWRKFLGNADAVYWLGLGANDTESPEALARILGNTTRRERVRGMFAGKSPVQMVERPLIYPEQIPRLLRGSNIIVTRFDQRHLRVKAVPYYRELPVTHYTPDPKHGEKRGRVRGRRWIEWCRRRPIDHDTAMSIFGLTPGYSRSEVETRFGLLKPTCDRNEEFAAAVARARLVLLRRAAA